MAVLLVVGFVAGLLTIISPCILPVLPAVIASGVTAGGRRRALAIASWPGARVRPLGAVQHPAAAGTAPAARPALRPRDRRPVRGRGGSHRPAVRGAARAPVQPDRGRARAEPGPRRASCSVPASACCTCPAAGRSWPPSPPSAARRPASTAGAIGLTVAYSLGIGAAGLLPGPRHRPTRRRDDLVAGTRARHPANRRGPARGQCAGHHLRRRHVAADPIPSYTSTIEDHLTASRGHQLGPRADRQPARDGDGPARAAGPDPGNRPDARGRRWTRCRRSAPRRCRTTARRRTSPRSRTGSTRRTAPG